MFMVQSKLPPFPSAFTSFPTSSPSAPKLILCWGDISKLILAEGNLDTGLGDLPRIVDIGGGPLYPDDGGGGP